MVFLLEAISLGYKNLVEWGDPRLSHLPFMGSPLPVVVILSAYLAFVLKIGPQMMKNKKPYDIQQIMRGYNVLQIFCNCVAAYLAIIYFPHVNIFCTPVDNPNLAICHYLFLLLKIGDLVDTVFFVLRKKYNQITFLHLYHHTLMFLGTWVTCKYVPGGQLYFVGAINSVVHIAMYIYYFLTSVNSDYKNSVWWKRHLTELQIAQHCMIFCSLLVAFLNPTCSYPKIVLIAYLPANLLMIYLFTKFYIKAYRKKDTAAKE